MKKITKTVYSILWPHSKEAVFSFCEMGDHGCVTVGKQQVELIVHEVKDADKEIHQAKIAALELQRNKLDRELQELKK